MRLFTFLAVLAIAFAGPAIAQEKNGAVGLASSLDGSLVLQANEISTLGGASASPLSVNGVDSWDVQGDSDNIVMNLDIGAGNEVTGISFDVNLNSVGASWCSEADIFFTDSALTTGVILTPGVGVDMPCTMDFSSGGVDDVTMFGVIAGADGILRIEFAESFDDVADAVDTNLADVAAAAEVPGFGLVCVDQGACDVALGLATPLPEPPAVPALNMFGLFALALMLVVGTLLVMRRKA